MPTFAADPTINGAVLADIIILRLNKLIEDDDVRKDIASLLGMYVECSKATRDHPTIQAVERDASWWLGPHGLLNGLVGAIPDGPRKGWGLITAEYDDSGALIRFMRTPVPKDSE